mmetsp:Transcript_101983/g.271384  ORF Transcript_101983/g.271384 Transcript_101983/m.271384 type:complete len:205 (-) Transcript_101983:464-1078(-)
MYHVVSSALNPMCFPRTLPRMRSSEPAQIDTTHTRTPSSTCWDSVESLEVSSSASVTSPAQATPTATRPNSDQRTFGKAPGWKIPMTACIANVTNGRQERITKFSEMATSVKLKLLRPMLAAKARDRHSTVPISRADVRRFGSQRQAITHETRKKAVTARKATTCCAPVMRKAAGTPFRPNSAETVASERTSFMYKLRPDCAPK